MEFDIAICYFGLTRSTKRVYESHGTNVFAVLKRFGLTYKTFMHTWKTADNKQRVWETVVPQEIDYSEYALLKPDVYRLDSQDEFLSTINMDDYFYRDVYAKYGHSRSGEWLPSLVRNHICALESQKRSLELAEASGIPFKYVMFIRPDVQIQNELPIASILEHPTALSIPNEDHNEGLNDRFAIVHSSLASLYGKRINELVEYRKHNGRIVSEKYVKYIVNKYNIQVHEIPFQFSIVRPS